MSVEESQPAEAPCPASGPSPLEVKGDAGIDGKAIDHQGDVRICGSICHGIAVRASGSITVLGTIELAGVDAGGDLTCEGSIVGRGKGRYTAAHGISCRSCNSGTLQAGDDVTVAVELVSSRVTCGGVLRAATAHVFGGHITANGGVECNVLGTPGNAETVVEVGLDEPLLSLSDQQAPSIEANFKRAEKIRSQVKPLLDVQRSLTAKQKETATELLFQADELREKTDAIVVNLREHLTRALQRARTAVTVNSMAYPGVTLRFPSGEYRVERVIKGPVRFECRGKGTTATLVVIDLETQAETTLGLHKACNPRLATLLRALTPPKPERQSA